MIDATVGKRPIDLISDIAMPMLARSGDEVVAGGTALIIAPGLGLVSQHIVDGFAARFGAPGGVASSDGALGTIKEGGSGFGLLLCQVVDDAVEQSLWQVTRLVRSRFTDVAVIAFDPASDRVRPDLLRRADLALLPPRVGARVAAFGFLPSPAAIVAAPDGPKAAWSVATAHAAGVVSAVFPDGAPRTGLRWPSFRVEVRVEGAVTGGPVFDLDTGRLCGLVCASDAVDDAIYAVALWPVMATTIAVRATADQAPERRSLRDLARDGHLSARDFARVAVAVDRDGNPTSVKLVDGDAAGQ